MPVSYVRLCPSDFCKCRDVESDPNFTACEKTIRDEYSDCIVSCSPGDFTCVSICSRNYDEALKLGWQKFYEATLAVHCEIYHASKLFIKNCPCNENCPQGCPCPNYTCLVTTTTTSSTQSTQTTTQFLVRITKTYA